MDIRGGGYEGLVTTLIIKVGVDLSSEEPVEIKGLLLVPKDGYNRYWYLVCDGGRYNSSPQRSLYHPDCSQSYNSKIVRTLGSVNSA